jgi:hypothetical protein
MDRTVEAYPNLNKLPLGSVHPPSVTVLEVQYRPRLLAYNVTVKASIEDTTD